AQACTQHLAGAYHQADLPQHSAGQQEHRERAQVRAEVEELGVGSGLEDAEPGQADEAQHQERTGARAEHAVVEADHRHAGEAKAFSLMRRCRSTAPTSGLSQKYRAMLNSSSGSTARSQLPGTTVASSAPATAPAAAVSAIGSCARRSTWPWRA